MSRAGGGSVKKGLLSDIMEGLNTMAGGWHI